MIARPADVERGKVVMHWGLRHEEDLYWIERLDALRGRSPRFTYTIHMSQPSAAWSGARGRITDPVLREAKALAAPVFYIVGNGDMIRDVKDGLVAQGVDRKKQIRTEVFYPATTSAAKK
jgi:ferredoxin-NADP reductase